jgi:hypothetical protein
MKNLKKHFLTWIILSFIGLFGFSCTETKSGKIKDLDSIRSTSNYHSKPKPIQSADVFQALLDRYNQDSVQLAISSMSKDTTDSFLDQFIFEKADRYFLTDSNQHAYNHRFWLFKNDSNAVKNTFYNWFDQQFCQRNATIKILSRQKLYPGNLVFICTNQSIHVVSSESKIDLLKWLRFIQFTENKTRFIYICQQVKNKPALWYSYNLKKTTLIPAQ